jgi:nicotinamide-nucleotide amidase
MIDDEMQSRAADVLALCRAQNLKIATVESCTGGLLSAALTAIAGSSDVVERGFVTYSNEAKTQLVGVPWQLIGFRGAVSEEVARAMAEGGLTRSGAQIAVAITGIAGPGGGSATKPVGLVHFGCALKNALTEVRREVFPGDRAAIRRAAVMTALDMVASAARAAH